MGMKANASSFRSMLELAQSLVLNEEALHSLPENKRPVFIYEWLCFLNKVLVAAQKVILVIRSFSLILNELIFCSI